MEAFKAKMGIKSNLPSMGRAPSSSSGRPPSSAAARPSSGRPPSAHAMLRSSLTHLSSALKVCPGSISYTLSLPPDLDPSSLLGLQGETSERQGRAYEPPRCPPSCPHDASEGALGEDRGFLNPAHPRAVCKPSRRVSEFRVPKPYTLNPKPSPRAIASDSECRLTD